MLSRDNEGRYWLVAKGRNPTLVNGREISREEPTEVAPDQKIAICNFVIRIQPKIGFASKKNKSGRRLARALQKSRGKPPSQLVLFKSF